MQTNGDSYLRDNGLERIILLNALTVDLEDWYQTHDFNLEIGSWGQYEDRIRRNTNILLEVFAKYKVKGTFFVLGCIAEKHPDLIRQIVKDGHEIGSHGGWHKMVNAMSPDEFRRDIIYSKDTLEDITGKQITCYRAPSWSINEESLWALTILAEEGFTCDSSIQPFRTPLSGMADGPYQPFFPVINGKRLNLVEFPTTILRVLGINIPFSGGFYLRLCPSSLIAKALNRVNKKRGGMIYIHPWEIDYEQPRLQASHLIRFVHYYNLKNTMIKLEKLLKNFSFATLSEVLKDGNYPELELKRP